jgi:hypothetical protein
MPTPTTTSTTTTHPATRQLDAIDTWFAAWVRPESVMPFVQAWTDGVLGASLATQDVLQDTWRAYAAQGDRALQEMLAHLRYSVLDLLDQLDAEHAAREKADASTQRLQAQLAREHERLEREVTTQRRRADKEAAERRRAERERDETRRRAEQAEAAGQRLERELARERERLQQQQQQPPHTEPRSAQAASTPRAEAQAEAPTVSVVRREDDFAVMREGATRASGVFDTMAEAVGRAREIAHNEHADLRLPAPEVGPANNSNNDAHAPTRSARPRPAQGSRPRKARPSSKKKS